MQKVILALKHLYKSSPLRRLGLHKSRVAPKPDRIDLITESESLAVPQPKTDAWSRDMTDFSHMLEQHYRDRAFSFTRE
jgi:hypothetical protein